MEVGDRDRLSVASAGSGADLQVRQPQLAQAPICWHPRTVPNETESSLAYLTRRAAAVNAYLATAVPSASDPPGRLHEAMRYSLLGGGKRLRPVLCLCAGEALGASESVLLPVAAALEMIHTYSLIHDDLPAMDDDDLRRGRPTCHRAFDEATAILAGDALLTRAFGLVSEARLPAVSALAVVRTLASAAGAGTGMVGGQALDLASEGAAVTIADVERIHRAKTGALLRASVVCGGLAAGGSPDAMDAFSHFGDAIGLAFQIVDDLLDRTAGAAALGKTPGKDEAARKATFPAVLGVAASEEKARELLAEACAALAPLGERAARLTQLARFVVERGS
jgi:geranylgeranyl diphosphate synthase type II